MNPLAMIGLIIFMPLLGACLSCFLKERAPAVATFSIGTSLLLSVGLLFYAPSVQHTYEWVPGIALGIRIDRVAFVLLALVNVISFLVHVFSMAYMTGDRAIVRYYAKLGFFTFSMLGLLIADDFILLFVFWELVGFASYLLIGFWYHQAEASSSARWSFMVNKVADVALLAGILLINAYERSFIISSYHAEWLVLPSVLVALGAFGKSAQLPFSGWLIKAMTGPTPVSALIHAATMVAAGVYLLFRVAAYLAPEALTVIAVLGTLTALYGGMSAMTQHNIKRLLAYSTISQLGYMVAGIGVGASGASLFHLWTHAFFKAGLFLGAGVITHFLRLTTAQAGRSLDYQDIRNMGGLRQLLPWTYRSFLVCSAALIGLPFFSGFLSKEGILLKAWAWAEETSGWGYPLAGLLLFSTLLTAFYATRMVTLIFFGKVRAGEWLGKMRYAQNWKLTLPLVVLSMGTFWFFYQWNPFGHHSYLLSYIGFAPKETEALTLLFLLLCSLLLSIGGIFWAHRMFMRSTIYSKAYKNPKRSYVPLTRIMYHGFHLIPSYEWMGKSFVSLSQKTARVDKKVLDWSLHLLGVGFVVSSKVVAIIDRLLVDGMVHFIAWISKMVGRGFSSLHARESQVQILWLLVAFLLILGWILLS